MEVARPPGSLLERFGDACSTANEFLVQLLNPRHGQVRIEMLARPPVGALRLESRCALEVDDRLVAGHARVEALVDEVAGEAEALLVERQCGVQLLDQELGRRSEYRSHRGTSFRDPSAVRI